MSTRTQMSDQDRRNLNAAWWRLIKATDFKDDDHIQRMHAAIMGEPNSPTQDNLRREFRRSFGSEVTL